MQVESLAKQALHDPVEIQVGGRSVVNKDITQLIEIRPEADRFLRLLEILGEFYEAGKILIFVASQDLCDNLFRDLLKVSPKVTLANLASVGRTGCSTPVTKLLIVGMGRVIGGTLQASSVSDSCNTSVAAYLASVAVILHLDHAKHSQGAHSALQMTPLQVCHLTV